jgi:phosphoglucomutase
LRPTPLLSYAIRELGCQSGVVLTASHNPKEYNGYKAYWNDGAQMIAPHDTNVIDEVNAIKDPSDIKFDRVDDNIQIIPDSLEKGYLDKVQAISISPDAIARQSDLKIVFTPIHGTGITLVPDLLEKFGFKNVTVLESQSKPDGNFPTVVYPNPEESEALSLAIAKAKEIDADLVLATDPDADRVGIAIKNNKNEWQLLNGNQTGSLMLYYIIKALKEQNKLKSTDYIVKTIVTSNLMDTIAQKNGVECYNVLTGFKFIADIMGKNEGKKQYIFGGEESYGYLVQDFVRDKDAVSACAFIAEMVAYAKDKGTSAFDMLLSMYQENGYYKESLISITKKGKSGAEEIKAMMNRLRENPPKTVAGSALINMADYENSVEKDLNSGQSSKLAFPKSDVLQFFTADGTKISARPSGTEPKIKFYVSVNEPMASKADYELVSQKLDKKIESVLTDLGLK